MYGIQATMLFAELTYTLATEEAERIGVDHVARMTAMGTGEDSTGNYAGHQMWFSCTDKTRSSTIGAKYEHVDPGVMTFLYSFILSCSC